MMRNLIIPWYYYLNNKINNNSSMLYVFCLLLQVHSPPFLVILLGIWSYLDRQICPDYSWASLTSSFLLGLANGEHWQEIGVRGIYFPASSWVWGLPWAGCVFPLKATGGPFHTHLGNGCLLGLGVVKAPIFPALGCRIPLCGFAT